MATLGTLLAPDLIQTGSCWQLCTDVNGYSRSDGESLTTQACQGRRFRILEKQRKRIAVQLLEDGYRCWLELEAVLGLSLIHICRCRRRLRCSSRGSPDR